MKVRYETEGSFTKEMFEYYRGRCLTLEVDFAGLNKHLEMTQLEYDRLFDAINKHDPDWLYDYLIGVSST